MKAITAGIKLMQLTQPITVLLLVVAGSILQGCATNRPLTLEERATLSPMHVYRTETPKLQTRSFKGAVFDKLGGNSIYADSGKSFTKATELPYPDFGLTVMQCLSNYLTNTIPVVYTAEAPVQSLKRSDGSVFLISVDSMTIGFLGWGYGGGYGFNIMTTMCIYDSAGVLRWHEMFFYNTGNYKKNKKRQTDYFDNNLKELNDELRFAADITAKQFADTMNGRKKSMGSPFRPIYKSLE